MAGGQIGARGRAAEWLQQVFDWFSGLPAEEAGRFRADIFATVMLRPSALLISSLGILLMSGTVAFVLRRPWAIAWFVFDIVMLAARVAAAARHQRRGGRMPVGVARVTVTLTLLVLVIFGLGCATAFMSAVRPLPMIATTSIMALFAGLATRWAALPRLAIPTIAGLAVPFLLAIIVADHGHFAIGAPQFAVVVAGTAALTLQNHRVLVAMFRARQEAQGLAMTDVLTGLPNRAALLDRLERTGDSAGRSPGLAMLFVDMDRFKSINDRFGHTAGDRVLIEAARRLAVAAAPHFVCRLGGDEFVVIIEGRDVAAANLTARRIAEALAEPFVGVAAEPILAGASVGIAFGSAAAEDAALLLADADRALYLAKGAGGGREAMALRAAVATAA
ncbi:MAG: diguanylate cyclase domain-containing protein [Sphingomonas sp.]